jgi:hypothetical protein
MCYRQSEREPILLNIFMLNKLIHVIVLTIISTMSFCQDSLCYDNIDKVVAVIQNIKCSKLDTGSISEVGKDRYRECYITDSTGKELLGLMTSVRDASGYSTNVNYYFQRKNLIKVEIGDWNGERKSNLQYYYYTTGHCQPFILDKHSQALRLYYKRLAHKIIQHWGEKPN